MAHKILYKPTGLIASYNLNDINVSVDGNSFIAVFSVNGRALLNEKFYAYNGSVSIKNLSSLVEIYMRDNDLQFADFLLTLKNDEGSIVDFHSFYVLYCASKIQGSISNFVKQHFLSSLSFTRLPNDFILPLFFFDITGTHNVVKFAFRIVSKNKHISGNFQIDFGTSADFSINQLYIDKDLLLSNIKSELGLEDFELISFSVYLNDRAISCTIDPSISYDGAFAYRNYFNVWELLTIPSTTTSSLEFDRSIVSVDGMSRSYDLKSNKSSKSKIGPITSDEWVSIEQFLSSHKIFQIFYSRSDDELFDFFNVIITDEDCDFSDAELNFVQVEWQYSDSKISHLLPKCSEIFSNHFDLRFN